MQREDIEGQPADSPPAAPQLELLAPAGDWASLVAALDAGADSVYFGLTVLNARRRARNFEQAEFTEAVRVVHERGAKGYLTLNIDLADAELAQAATILQLAHNAGVDGVLIRDPALLLLGHAVPGLALHLSTQSCAASSADVEAGVKLGAARVVLAREMRLDEISAAAAVPGIETEVFVQGALCCSVSGRCLMSSWVGGRSGNRGACTSPCRVPWTVDGTAAGTPFSMRDLAALERLDALREAGVTALKIEGRMKTAEWVGRAVRVYRRALQGEPAAQLADDVTALGAYTGRQMTCGYLDGRCDELTGVAGRERQRPLPDREPASDSSEFEEAASAPTELSAYELEIQVTERGIECRCQYAGEEATWTLPKTVVRRAHKAVTIGQLLEFFGRQTYQGCTLRAASTNAPDFLMVPRKVNFLGDQISKFLQLRRRKHRQIDLAEQLPVELRSLIDGCERCPSNRTSLGQPPDRARISVEDVAHFVEAARPEGLIVAGATAERIRELRSRCRRTPLTIALPPVLFEDQLDEIRNLLRECVRARCRVEVNSWGGWHLARQAGAKLDGGPHLPVLNALAGRLLGSLGMESVTLSIEADRRKLERVTERCPVPCALVIFGRPPLMITRAELPPDFEHHVLADRRDTRVVARREHGLWVLRPVEPFDLRGIANERIRVRHQVVDLVASPDPVGEWFAAGRRRDASSFQFNYGRTLY